MLASMNILLLYGVIISILIINIDIKYKACYNSNLDIIFLLIGEQ